MVGGLLTQSATVGPVPVQNAPISAAIATFGDGITALSLKYSRSKGHFVPTAPAEDLATSTNYPHADSSSKHLRSRTYVVATAQVRARTKGVPTMTAVRVRDPDIPPRSAVGYTARREEIVHREVRLTGYPGTGRGEMYEDLDEVAGVLLDTNTLRSARVGRRRS